MDNTELKHKIHLSDLFPKVTPRYKAIQSILSQIDAEVIKDELRMKTQKIKRVGSIPDFYTLSKIKGFIQNGNPCGKVDISDPNLIFNYNGFLVYTGEKEDEAIYKMIISREEPDESVPDIVISWSSQLHHFHTEAPVFISLLKDILNICYACFKLRFPFLPEKRWRQWHISDVIDYETFGNFPNSPR